MEVGGGYPSTPTASPEIVGWKQAGGPSTPSPPHARTVLIVIPNLQAEDSNLAAKTLEVLD